MFLKRLEIHGFKSFAQKTTLEFDKGIIAIVGPNGSGKSNVADSLRWVLGEQSPKIIRGKKSDDVIFAGSDKKTRLGFAEVTATFDNRDHRIPLDAAEVSIGRRIDRSGESEYLINGNKVRLLDVVDLVLKSNIGTSRYTVIGQGTIDQMILAGSSEVKNLIDEASGVKTYYIKRGQTLRRLDQTAQNLMRAEDLMAEIEPRLKSLRRQAKKMEARSEIEQELRMLQREFFGRNFWQLKAASDKFVDQLGKINAQRKSLEESMAQKRKSADDAEAGSREQDELFRGIQEQINRLQAQKNKLLEDLSLVRGKMQSQKTAVAGDPQTLQVELHNKERDISEIKEKIKIAQNEQAAAQAKRAEQHKQHEELDGKIKQLYSNLKNPQIIDWALFDLELKSVELSFAQFLQSLENPLSPMDIKSLALQMQKSFEKFKTVLNQTVRHPQQTADGVKKEFDALVRQKDEAAGLVANLEVAISKAKVSLEFLEKQSGQFEQQRLHLDLELKKAQSASADDFWKNLTDEEQRIETEMKAVGGKISEVEQSVRAFMDNQDKKNKAIHEAESDLRRLSDELSKIKDQESALAVEKAKIDTQMNLLSEDIRRTLGQEGLALIAEKDIESKTEGLDEKIARLKNQLDMIGGLDDLTMQEYRETESRYSNLSGQVQDLRKGMEDLRSVMDELDEHIKQKFNEAFYKINEKFEHYFRVLFSGGRALLSVVRNEEAEKTQEQIAEEAEDEDQAAGQNLRPEEKVVKSYEKGASNITGIDIKATPPGKKLSNIQALSGGERSLTSIALLCSLLTCFPSPFVVLDEVDAALDDANTIRFGQILGTLAHQTQFLTITHNRETMAQSGMLYGVTMGDDGVSKLLSVKLDQAKQYAK